MGHEMPDIEGPLRVFGREVAGVAGKMIFYTCAARRFKDSS